MAASFDVRRSLGALAAALLVTFSGGTRLESSQRVSIRTDDGVTLAGTWYEPSARQAPAVVLLHMLHRSRRDWDAAAQRFASEGIGALAIDLRGHGESGGAAGGDGDLASLVLDVKAARRFVAQHADIQQTRVALIGASLGANLAALEAAADPSVAAVALLSPSLDYRGLRIEAALRKLTRPALLVASDDDPYATRSARDLQKAGGGPRELLVTKQAGHGTAMLTRDPDLLPALVDWVRRTLL